MIIALICSHIHLHFEYHVRFIVPYIRPIHDLSGLMEMLIAQFTFSIFCLNMVDQIPYDTHPRLVVIYSNSERVPISFPLGNDRVAHVTSLRLSLRFQMSEEIMFIDEEVYDAQFGDLIYTIG